MATESSPKTVIVRGGAGSGKSATAAALQAEAVELGASTAVLHAGEDVEAAIRNARGCSLMIVDGLHELPPRIRAHIFEKRQKLAVRLITTKRLTAREQAMLDDADLVLDVPPLEERPEDALTLAAMAWREQAPGLGDLHSYCTEDTANELAGGVWFDGGRSVRRVVASLAEGLHDHHASTAFDRTNVLNAIIVVARDEAQRALGASRHAVLVVEGRTDIAYLRAAASRANDRWGCRLLTGLELLSPGGAEMVVRELLRLDALGTAAVGLVDSDEAGRAALRDAKRFGLLVVPLPWEFDPLRRPQLLAEFEIEDLVPKHVLEAFLRSQPGRDEEERVIRGGLERIVVRARDKEELAQFVAASASFADLERVAWVACHMRQLLRLELPVQALPLDTWKRRLAEGP